MVQTGAAWLEPRRRQRLGRPAQTVLLATAIILAAAGFLATWTFLTNVHTLLIDALQLLGSMCGLEPCG